jgi:hypothetical protein
LATVLETLVPGRETRAQKKPQRGSCFAQPVALAGNAGNRLQFGALRKGNVKETAAPGLSELCETG